MEATVFSSPAFTCVAMELMHHLCWLLEIFPRTFRTNIQTAFWVASPAIESLIPKVVWVCVCVMLMPVVAFAVEVSVTLESLWPVSGCEVLVREVEEDDGWTDQL